MQRLLLLGVCLVTFLAGTLSAPALEVKDRAKAPLGWWDSTAPMAIPPQYFDQVLSAYGLTLVDASKAPPTYARKVEDRVVWETAPRTYTPQEMDQILSAYGATLADASKAPPTYVRTVDGKPQFENAPIAWSPQVINAILAAYR
jgi:hypothetical protein